MVKVETAQGKSALTGEGQGLGVRARMAVPASIPTPWRHPHSIGGLPPPLWTVPQEPSTTPAKGQRASPLGFALLGPGGTAKGFQPWLPGKTAEGPAPGDTLGRGISVLPSPSFHPLQDTGARGQPCE